VDVGYIEREGRSLVATEKGIQVIRLLNGHPLTSPELTGSWEQRLGKIEQGADSREAFMGDIAKFTGETVQELDKLKGVRIERAKLGPCPVCGREITENRKGYSCWSRDDPGCGFVIWKRKAGKSLPVSVAKELIENLRASREAGEDPGVGRTAKQITGFRGRSGRTFRAKLKLEQDSDGKWRVDFDEDWAKEPPKDQEEDAGGDGAAAAGEDGAKADADGDGAQADAEADGKAKPRKAPASSGGPSSRRRTTVPGK
jgi:DNA topoisomerase III